CARNLFSLRGKNEVHHLLSGHVWEHGLQQPDLILKAVYHWGRLIHSLFTHSRWRSRGSITRFLSEHRMIGHSSSKERPSRRRRGRGVLVIEQGVRKIHDKRKRRQADNANSPRISKQTSWMLW